MARPVTRHRSASRATIGAMTTRRGPRPTQVRPRPPSSGRPAPSKARPRAPQPGRITAHRPIQRGRGIPLIGKVALTLAVVALGAGVLYVALGGLRAVAGSVGTSLAGFVHDVTATPTPAPTVATISDAPLLAAPDEPYTNTSKVDLVVTVPAELVGSTDHVIRVYLALKDQPPAAIQEVPIGTTAKTVIPIELEKGINDFTVTIVGPGGESDTSPVVRYVLDTAKPKMTITSPKANSKVNGKSVEHQGQGPGALDADRAQRRQRRLDHGDREVGRDVHPQDRALDGDQPHHHHRHRPGRQRERQGAHPPPRDRQADGVDLGLGLPHLPPEPAGRRAAPLLGHRPERAAARGCRRDVHPEHPGHPDDHLRRDVEQQRSRRVRDDDPEEGDRYRPGQRDGASPRPTRSGRRRTTRSSRSPSRPVREPPARTGHRGLASARIAESPRRSYHRRMPMWRCPHCGTPQVETARCWVCHRSSTACLTCRHFRRSVAAQLGYCGLDVHRLPLRGDEIRPCWEAGKLPEAPTITAAAPPEASAAHRQFVEVRARPRKAVPGATPPVDEPVPAVPLAAEPRWSLWED